jgi:transposase InsO family protein
MVIFNERHARRIIGEFLQYYHHDRTHQGLGQEAPNGRKIDPPNKGMVNSRLILGGLHHRYFREAAGTE